MSRSWGSHFARGVRRSQRWVSCIEVDLPTAKLLVGVFVDQVLAGELTFRGKRRWYQRKCSMGLSIRCLPIFASTGASRCFLYGSPTSLQVLRNLPRDASVTDDPNVATFEMGSIVPVTAWRTFPDHFEAPMTWKRMQSVTQVGLLGGGMQQQAEGAPADDHRQHQFPVPIRWPPSWRNSTRRQVSRLSLPKNSAWYRWTRSLVYFRCRGWARGTSGDPVSQRISTYGSGLVYEELI